MACIWWRSIAMRLIQYLLSVLLALVVTLLACLFAPILPLFADSKCNLPQWLRWFQTPDNPICGDVAFLRNQAQNDSHYWRSVKWLWRNPAQGLDQALGAQYPLDERPLVKGNPAISDVGGVAGWCWITFGGYFHLISIVPVGFGKCIHAEFGWRIQQIAQDYAGGIANPMTRQLVFTFRLFRFGA